MLWCGSTHLSHHSPTHCSNLFLTNPPSPPPHPPSLETIALQVPLPTADMDMSTEEYARVVCALLDVPVHSGGSGEAPGNLIQSLHLIFSTYMEFKSNAHFAGGGY